MNLFTIQTHSNVYTLKQEVKVECWMLDVVQRHSTVVKFKSMTQA